MHVTALMLYNCHINANNYCCHHCGLQHGNINDLCVLKCSSIKNISDKIHHFTTFIIIECERKCDDLHSLCYYMPVMIIHHIIFVLCILTLHCYLLIDFYL